LDCPRTLLTGGSEAAQSYRDLLAHKLREKSKAGVDAMRAAFSFSGRGGDGSTHNATSSGDQFD
jgi:hypothetical protein